MTTIRMAKTNVLNDIISSHAAYFFRIFDYKDELLRINPESILVVKLRETNALGGKYFRVCTFVLMH